MQTLRYKQVSKADWLIPAGLLPSVSFPSLRGGGGLASGPLAAGTEVTPEADHKAKSVLEKGHSVNGLRLLDLSTVQMSVIRC